MAIFASLHAAGRADQPRRGLPRRHGQHGRLRRRRDDRTNDQAARARRGRASSSRVGVATNKLCAKVASDLRKPDALVVVPPGEEAAFLAPLPIRRLWGVGPQAQAALGGLRGGDDRAAGGDAAGHAAPPIRAITATTCRLALAASTAAASQVTPRRRRASATSTRSTPTSADVGRLEATLLDLAESVASRLRRHDLAAGSVQLKLRYEGFETLTRQAPLPRQTREARVALRRDAGAAAPDARRRARRPADRPHRHQPLRRPAAHAVRRAGPHGSPDARRSTRSASGSATARSPARACCASAPHRRFDFGERPDAPSSEDDDEA